MFGRARRRRAGGWLRLWNDRQCAEMTNVSKVRVETLAPWAAGLLLACPVLVAYYPPMTDLPYHEAAIGILRHFGDRSMFPPGLYERNLGEPNQLFHMVGWALSYILSTRWSVKLVVAATVVAIPVCAARFARHAGASPLAALLVTPMALGWLFSWGLVANLIGLAALLAVLPMLDRFAREPTGGAALRCVGGAVLLYFAHEAMMFVYAGVAFALALVHPWSRRGTTLRLVPFAASIAIAAVQARWQVRYTLPLLRVLPPQWDSTSYKLEKVPSLILPATDLAVQIGTMTLFALALGSLFGLRARERRVAGARTTQPSSGVERFRTGVLVYRWEVFVAMCLVAYLSFPFSLNGATYVYQRWLPPGFAVLALVAAPRDLWTSVGRVARIVLAASPVATVLVASPSFADSGREYKALDELVSRIEMGSAVAHVDLGPVDPTRTYSLSAASGRILATRGGRLAFAFTYSSISPVVIPERYQWTDSTIRMGVDSSAFSPAYDFRRFRYLLVHPRRTGIAWVAMHALRPEAEYVGAAGEWMLFKSKLPIVPLLSTDTTVTVLPWDTLRGRILAMLPAEPARHGPEL
jgi:hypothetical protein